jgi:signal transduction histidine kinase
VIPIPQTESSGLSERNPVTAESHLHAALIQCTLELADSKRAFRKAVAQRKSVESALKASKRVTSQLLKKSSHAEERLKGAVRKILSEDEEDRKHMSLRLHDEIVQMLLGIQVRMLALSKAAAGNADLPREIATTQRLVGQAVRIIERLAREFGIRDEGSAD